MRYKVGSMSGKTSASGSSYELGLESYNPDYQCTILAIDKDDFDRVKVGDHLELLVTVVPAEV